MKGKRLFSWAGGKSWLSKELLHRGSLILSRNKDISCYIEPFAGGLGSFFLMIPALKKHGIKKVYLNDVNESLIGLYKDIKKDDEALLGEYTKIENGYSLCIDIKEKGGKYSKKEKKKLLATANEYYLEKRTHYNKIKNTHSILRSALLLFLLNHCFNAMYRENQREGSFNSPYNWEIRNDLIEKKSRFFKDYVECFEYFDIDFSCGDAIEFIQSWNEKNKFIESLIYFDPPYLNEDSGELSYNKDAFGLEKQKAVLKLIKDGLAKNFIFSNHRCSIFTIFAKNNNMGFFYKKRHNRINPKFNVIKKEIVIYSK